MRLVILESPFAGDVPGNIAYARKAVRDCLARGEAPIASHLLFTQTGVLDDGVPEQRKLGIAGGLAWYGRADAGVFYLDRGMSAGMQAAKNYAEGQGVRIELRFIGDRLTDAERDHAPEWFHWEAAPMCTAVNDQVAEMRLGRLQARRSGRPPTAAAPFEVSFCGRLVAFYCTMEQARTGAELFYAWAAARAPAEAGGDADAI